MEVLTPLLFSNHELHRDFREKRLDPPIAKVFLGVEGQAVRLITLTLRSPDLFQALQCIVVFYATFGVLDECASPGSDATIAVRRAFKFCRLDVVLRQVLRGRVEQRKHNWNVGCGLANCSIEDVACDRRLLLTGHVGRLVCWCGRD